MEDEMKDAMAAAKDASRTVARLAFKGMLENAAKGLTVDEGFAAQVGGCYASLGAIIDGMDEHARLDGSFIRGAIAGNAVMVQQLHGLREQGAPIANGIFGALDQLGTLLCGVAQMVQERSGAPLNEAEMDSFATILANLNDSAEEPQQQDGEHQPGMYL